jgi:dTDP-4-dehydrorhamnose 3,5-epimerase
MEVELIHIDCYTDERGSFMQSYDRKIKEQCNFKVVQENISISNKNVLRGMHYQWTKPMSKLVQCVHGTIIDFVLDIRKESKTFGESKSFVLDSPTKMLLVPAGFAHGFFSACEHSVVKYHCSCYYNKDGEDSINFFDSDLELKKMLTIGEIDVIMSERDRQAIAFSDYAKQPKF